MRRRLVSLAVLELVNIPLFAFVLFGLLDVPPSAANLAGFGLFALLLVEGSAYWWLKLRQLRTGTPLPAGTGVFRVLLRVNVALLAAGGALVLWQLSGGARWIQVLPGLGLWLFAILEHVNYFHVQLMHDTRADLSRLLRSGLHRSHLWRDMDRHRRASAARTAG
ncbi:hypothetical protein [Nocardiopsis algeriensis]|uniref:Apolipoprotein N-acyltransferase n=1 Tax=Nocardiopsis algeriensis TaxID=1478215 RepID=A0A841ISW0_9ACTN|nr:hypothetical protein [Nocardiopsis algeriensis]MBB6121767.1 apolipoprotein N-acyltransferase [Nocardiopsis algeriensis]